MITTHQLTIGYGHSLADDLTLSFAPGQLHALLGPNGCGKTTLFKTLMGLIPALEGSVSLHGKDIRTLTELERARQIAYVPQSQHGVFPYTAFEMVLMGRTAHLSAFGSPSKKDHSLAIDAMDQLSIAHLGEQEFTKLSGGQRQLVMLARALAQGATTLVLDEPTASLDFGNEIRVLEAVSQLAKTGWTVILSTHNPSHALQLADRTVVLKEGQLLADGPSASVLTESLLSQLYDTDVQLGTVGGLPVVAAKML